MTDYKQLCADLLRELEHASSWDYQHVLKDQARAALAEPTPEIYYEFSVLNDEYCTEAGGTAPTLAQAISEGQHYLAEYSQDGKYTLEVRRVETIPVAY